MERGARSEPKRGSGGGGRAGVHRLLRQLINAFGPNKDAGYQHFATQGLFEGRTTSFDGLEYIASYGDLIKAFGANTDAGASHYIGPGHTEGRHVSFDGLEYIASYGDLINAFHNQVAASPTPEDIGATHYIGNGYAEHRAPDLFGRGPIPRQLR
jgi:hypothetical protein